MIASATNDERQELLDLSRRYFELKHKAKAFVPGETYVPASGKLLDAQDLVNLVDSCLDLWLTAGRFAKEFEARIPKMMNRSSKGLLVNSGSSANLVAISSLGSPLLEPFKMRPLTRGDEVITVAAGFPTTVNPIIQNGWRPVFVDVDLSTLNAVPEAIMAAKTEKTRAVVLAHTLGNPYRSDLLAAWCKANDLYLVEDCCDALGAEVTGVGPVGSFGDYATLSFYPAHHMTMGEGGAVIARDGRLRRVAESMRDWGRDCWCDPGQDNTCKKRYDWQLGELPHGYDHKYTYSSIGYNLKVTDMQAAIGLSQLDKVPGFVKTRNENWQTLNSAIRNSPILMEHLEPVQPTPGTTPSWFGFPIHCRKGIDRNALVAFLESKKVGTRLVFAGNLTKQPALKGADYRIHGSLENTDKIMESAFWIGVHPVIQKPHIEYMLSQLEAGITQQVR